MIVSVNYFKIILIKIIQLHLSPLDILVVKYFFPGSPNQKIVGKKKLIASDTSTQKLADFIVTSSKQYITFKEIQEKCGIESVRISKVLGSKTVKPVLKARNWVKKV